MSPPVQLKTSTSSKAARVRTSWFLIVTCVEEGVQELHLCWKYADHSVGFYSNTRKGSSVRPPWGKLVNCLFKNKPDKHGKLWSHHVCNNGRETMGFKMNEFNPALWGINSFTSKVLDMRSSGKEELLALYLASMVRSKSFSQYREGVHTEDGLFVDLCEAAIKKMEEVQGSLDDYKDFIEKAEQSCIKVNKMTEVMQHVQGGTRKRKNQDMAAPPVIKKSKADKIEEAKNEEINAENGIEKSYVDKYIGRAEIPLENLSCSMKVQLRINTFKVEGLVRSILERPDPALLTLTVCIADEATFDRTDMAKNSYEVIHGRHRYALS